VGDAMSVYPSPLVGKHGRVTIVKTEWNKDLGRSVEVSREHHTGEIVALVTQNNYPYLVMLWVDGSLSSHSIVNVTVVAEQKDPYR
jgi:hypothetical protein